MQNAQHSGMGSACFTELLRPMEGFPRLESSRYEEALQAFAY